MAYLAFDELAPGMIAAPAPRADPLPLPGPLPLHEAPARLSALEWSVVALAARDALSTLREPGRMGEALRTLFGGRHNPRLADPRLEALRRMAVLARHYGYAVPGVDVRDFLHAGFTPAQYELLVDSVTVARTPRRR